jgi:lipopolysaccharide export system protein LptA
MRILPFCSALILFVVFLSSPVWSQKRVKLKKADISRGGVKNGERVDWVIGNVVFTQNQTTIYCDSAQIFKSTNSVEAYGRVRITEGDSVTATAQRLTYDGNQKIARMRKKVVFTKLATATLYTDFLDFFRTKSEARYFNGGKLVDSTNTLTSQKGYYDLKTNLASFKTQVVGVNPEYTLTSDTLQYNSTTKIIYFLDSTTVVNKDGQTAVYQSGFYDTYQKKSNINKGEIETPTYRLKGDRYFLDDVRKLYKAKFNVVMTSKEENMIIYGDDGYYDKKTGVSKVYGNAYLTKVADDGDTLFLSADTLVSIENKDARKKRLLAYPNVKIFKSDMQGAADSLIYLSSDSVMYFFRNPALWTNGNQMTADTIRVELRNKNIDKIHLLSNSFVISQDTLTNFNQIKGRKMTAFFAGRDIHHVLVEGNGESLYYALQEEEQDLDSAILRITFSAGMNKMICSNMRINFTGGKVNNVTAYVMPDASFVPPHELKPDDQKLKGFVWRIEERPIRGDVVKKKKAESGPVRQPPN